MSQNIGIGVWALVVSCWVVIWIAFGPFAFVYGGVLLFLLIVLFGVTLPHWRTERAAARRSEAARRHANR